jgi:hypothetical protein
MDQQWQPLEEKTYIMRDIMSDRRKILKMYYEDIRRYMFTASSMVSPTGGTSTEKLAVFTTAFQGLEAHADCCWILLSSYLESKDLRLSKDRPLKVLACG